MNLCSICNGKLIRLEDNGKDYFTGVEGEFFLDFCEDCKVGYTNPMLSNKELEKYYPIEYESFTPKKSFYQFIQNLKYKSDLKLIKKFLKRNDNPKLFEIGTGRGEFLSFAQKYGFIVNGIEPGKQGVKIAKEKYGLDIENCFIDNYIFKEKYDIIVMRHVFEHFNNFIDVINNIQKNGLRNEGILFIKIPRLDSWEYKLFGKYWHGLDFPRHRVHFTKKGLINFITKYNFRIELCESETVYSDTQRSINNYMFDKFKLKNIYNLMFKYIPGILKTTLLQLVVKVLKPFGAGRLIIIGIKYQN